MGIQLLEPTDVIDVQYVPTLIFGPPGCGKTTLAQTADKPFTLDLDNGLHRATNRKAGVRFDTFEDVQQLLLDAGGNRNPQTPDRILRQFMDCRTVVVDTLGRLLDKMIPMIRSASAKNAGPSGLSPQGYGVLGNQFAATVKSLRDMGKDLVMLCHEEAGTDAQGGATVIPDMPGKMAWKEIHKWTDMIGRVRYDGRKRILDFNPGEGATSCKNAAYFDSLPVPNPDSDPRFLANLMEQAKLRIGKTAEASAAVAKIVAGWQAKLAEATDVTALNALVVSPELKELTPGAKKQVWTLFTRHGEEQGWTFDTAAKAFKGDGE